MCRESRTPNQHAELIHRHADNPSLTAQDWPYPGVHTVFNTSADKRARPNQALYLIRHACSFLGVHGSLARAGRASLVVSLAKPSCYPFRTAPGEPQETMLPDDEGRKRLIAFSLLQRTMIMLVE